MAKLKITAKALRKMGFPDSPVTTQALALVQKHYRFQPASVALQFLKEFIENPGAYRNDPVWGGLAAKQAPEAPQPVLADPSANREGIQFSVFGREHIEASAFHQMYQAARLPISVAGAIMPDGHSGYGLPIGGVLAVADAVIPNGVGVDIGCRMCLSIFGLDPRDLSRNPDFFLKTLDQETLFGGSAAFQRSPDHEVMDQPLFFEMPLLKSLHAKAWKQLGSSGSGNHFVEFGIVRIAEKDPSLGVEPGNYLGLLSHSGSRSLGAKIAMRYTDIAVRKRRLEQEYKHLAWLYLEEEEGAEYWAAMNLAGDYASACHEVIHAKIARKLGVKPLRVVENHHNFAWKEIWEGREVVVHRKGATPAGAGVLGVIPGSMTAPGFIVKGRGNAASVHSASHGAGRLMSRTVARNSITDKQMREALEASGVLLIGGGKDESPFAYKDIETVMQNQTELVDILGKFIPKIVKMDGAGRE
jgi:tRNA-splicing ligase RtcB